MSSEMAPSPLDVTAVADRAASGVSPRAATATTATRLTLERARIGGDVWGGFIAGDSSVSVEPASEQALIDQNPGTSESYPHQTYRVNRPHIRHTVSTGPHQAPKL